MAEEISFTTIDEYIAQFAPEIRERLQLMRQTIKQAAPEATEKISWAMPTFYLNGNLVHFAAFKKHIGFYPGADGIELFRNRFEVEGYTFSKGAVQFPLTKPLPVDLISEIVRFRVSQNEKIVPKKQAGKENEA